MNIMRNLNIWEHLKNNMEKNVVKAVVKKAEDESGEEVPPITTAEIIKELGMEDDLHNFLGSDFSGILMSEKVFESDIQDQFDAEIETKKNELKTFISSSDVVKNIEVLINNLQKCIGKLDEAVGAAVSAGSAALKKNTEEFKSNDTTDADDDEGLS